MRYRPFILSFLFAASAAFAQTTQPSAAPATAAGGLTDAQWQQILTRLGDTDFHVREQAQKDLAKVDSRQADILKKFAAEAADPEVKSRLEARLQEIAEDLAINPPPISLNLKNATYDETAAALGKALDIPLEFWPPHQRGSERFNLQAENKPYWEVFSALNLQHALTFQDLGSEGIRLLANGPAPKNMVLHGGFAIYPQNITRTRTANLQKPAGQELEPEQMNLSCTIMADPRIRILRQANPLFTEVVDDAGNTLLNRNVGGSTHFYGGGFRQTSWGVSGSLIIPPKLGKKIASAKGEISFEIQLAEETVEVADFESKFQEPITLGDRTVTFKQFELDKQGTLHFECLIPNPPQPPMRGGEYQEPVELRMQFIDAKGKVSSHNVSGGISGGGDQLVSPIKLRLSLPTKTQKVTVPFELKDLPLP